MLYVDQAIGQFRKRLASIIAMMSSHVEHFVEVFDINIIHLLQGSWLIIS